MKSPTAEQQTEGVKLLQGENIISADLLPGFQLVHPSQDSFLEISES